MDDELGSTAAALAESSATQRKWASFVLLGPLMPSLMAVVIVVIGGAIVKVIDGWCGSLIEKALGTLVADTERRLVDTCEKTAPT